MRPDLPDGEGYRLESLKKACPPRLDQVQKRNRPQTGTRQRLHHRIEGRGERHGLRGRSLAGVVLDEAAFMDSRGLVRGDPPRPRRQTRLGTLHLHPGRHRQLVLRPLVLLRRSRQPQLGRWQFTTIQGDNVPPEEIEAARGQLDVRTFRQEFEASFENLSGLVAISFSDSNIDATVQDLPVVPLLIGVDFNIDPMSASARSKRATTSGYSTKSS
jgi:hypothetical protein